MLLMPPLILDATPPGARATLLRRAYFA